MKQLLTFGLIFTMATSGLLFTACEGEDGEPGAIGDKGDKGDTGDTGANGVGFDEATQYGNVVVRYKGTRIDDVAFDQTVDFKFSPIGPDVTYTSSVWEYESEGGETETDFDITRYNSAIISPSEGSNSYIDIDYDRYSNGGDYLQFNTYVAIISSDRKFFRLNQYFGLDASEAVTEYNFNSATGELKFKFHVLVPANDEYNRTGHEIDITADVNVKVFTSLDSGE
jgi:hypothetical protein